MNLKKIIHNINLKQICNEVETYLVEYSDDLLSSDKTLLEEIEDYLDLKYYGFLSKQDKEIIEREIIRGIFK